MKKIIVLVLVVTAVFAFTACGNKEESSAGEDVQIPNPWIDCDTIDDAAKIAGFDITAPEKIDGYPLRIIQAVDGEIIQIIFSNEESYPDDYGSVTIRKGKGTDDISGDFNEYDEAVRINDLIPGGPEVSMQGKDGLIYKVTWTQNEYTYSITADNGMGRETAEELVTQIK